MDSHSMGSYFPEKNGCKSDKALALMVSGRWGMFCTLTLVFPELIFIFIASINLNFMKNQSYLTAGAAYGQCTPDYKPLASAVFIKLLASALLFLMAASARGQINMADSTSQVVAWWDKNESQNYTVTSTKIKVQGSDTISREIIQYDVDITVQDSTESGYVVNWFYYNYRVETDDELVKKLLSLAGDINVQIKTDEMGTFEEVINWEEIREYILKGTSMLKDETKGIPNMDKIISQMEGMYSSREAIEASAINEILQFHYFHGVQYKHWQEYSYDNKLANLFGGQPFDAKVTFWLDEINEEDNNAVYRMQQVVNSDQLTSETFNYLTNLAETMQAPGPVREEFPDLHNETWMASRIHGSGWVLYSIQTKEVIAENVMQIEECIIELNNQ